jgi:hypothetical protein
MNPKSVLIIVNVSTLFWGYYFWYEKQYSYGEFAILISFILLLSNAAALWGLHIRKQREMKKPTK